MGTGATKNGAVSFDGISSMPGGKGVASAVYSMSGKGNTSFGALPGGGRGGINPVGWFVGAALFAAAFSYWHFIIGNTRAEASVTRAWAKSAAVKNAAHGAALLSEMGRKKYVTEQRPALLSAFKLAARKSGAGDLAARPVPPLLAEKLEATLVKNPMLATQSLLNAAARREGDGLPFYPKLVTDTAAYTYTGLGLLGGCGVLALVGIIGLIPKRRTGLRADYTRDTAAAPPAPNIAAPRIMSPVAPAATVVAPATPFPPPPEAMPPTINAPARGSIAAGVAAVASSSSEVTRLVKRLEELESLSERLKGERDETRKELSWTQVALDDFKKRVSDATTMAAASAAQSAGASEQRAAQAEQRVTEAVEHINEALQRAVETEHGVTRAQEIAQTAGERASNAETRSQEMQYQLARAMERLADLERLAATTRLGGMGGPPGTVGGSFAHPALPAPDMNGYRNGASTPSPIDDMLAAAAKPATRPVVMMPTTTVMPSHRDDPVPIDEPDTMPTASSAPRQQRTPPPRLTNTKMSDIEAGLKLARSIRSRTQRAATKFTGDE